MPYRGIAAPEEDTSAHDQRVELEERCIEEARSDLVRWVRNGYAGDLWEVMESAGGDVDELICECIKDVYARRVAGQRNAAALLIEELAKAEGAGRFASMMSSDPS